MRSLFTWLSRSPRFVPALLALGFLLIGCGSGPTSSPSATASSTPTVSDIRVVSTAATKTYLGVVSGTTALIGIVLNGAQARAYVCDGTPSRFATLSEWFAGQVRSGTLAESLQDQAHLTAEIRQQSASGTLTLASGRAFTFMIPLVANTHQVGIFEGTDLIHGERYHAGWIVLPNGDQRGAATYPTGSVRGIVIALLPAFPTGPVRGIAIGPLPR